MNRTFEAMGAIDRTSFILTGFDHAEQLNGAMVSADFFRVLDVTPTAGRTFAPGEDEPGANRRIAVLAHDFWARRFAADPSVVGRTLMLDGRTYPRWARLSHATPRSVVEVMVCCTGLPSVRGK